jgi:hypothetical protein
MKYLFTIYRTLNDNAISVIEDNIFNNLPSKQNPHIEEEETRQWPKEKVQKDKQRSSKYYN